jgi:hypothetical protein
MKILSKTTLKGSHINTDLPTAPLFDPFRVAGYIFAFFRWFPLHRAARSGASTTGYRSLIPPGSPPYAQADPAARLFHVRTHDQLEVDGLVQLGRRFLPIETKAGVSPSTDQARAMNRWIGLNPDHGPGVVLHAGTEYFRLSRNAWALPVTALFGAECSAEGTI